MNEKRTWKQYPYGQITIEEHSSENGQVFHVLYREWFVIILQKGQTLEFQAPGPGKLVGFWQIEGYIELLRFAKLFADWCSAFFFERLECNPDNWNRVERIETHDTEQD
jgi:hypothetical protein